MLLIEQNPWMSVVCEYWRSLNRPYLDVELLDVFDVQWTCSSGANNSNPFKFTPNSLTRPKIKRNLVWNVENLIDNSIRLKITFIQLTISINQKKVAKTSECHRITQINLKITKKISSNLERNVKTYPIIQLDLR